MVQHPFISHVLSLWRGMKPNSFARVEAKTESETMTMTITRAALALAVALTSVPFGVSAASAQVELRIDRNGPQMRLRDDCDPDYEDCRVERRDYVDRRDSRDGRGCSPDRALRKAERMGIRRARIVDVGRRTIDIRGRDRRGERVVVSFGRRDRSCPVLGY